MSHFNTVKQAVRVITGRSFREEDCRKHLASVHNLLVYKPIVYLTIVYLYAHGRALIYCTPVVL